jgi:ABC-type transport system involved in multi-copper enzyme maturation permease subunit
MSALVQAELRKLFTTRAWWGMLIGVAGVSVAFSLLIALIAGDPNGGGLAGVEDPATVRTIYTSGISTTYLFSLAAGILAMAGEWRHQTISATFLASPRRARVVLAKIAGLVVLGGLYGLTSVVCGVLAGAPVVNARGGELRLMSDGVPRSLALGILAVALWALFGLGIATLIRNQVAALLLSIGVAWIVQPILSLVLTNGLHRPGIAAYLPSEATSAMLSPDVGSSGSHLLAWWAGALVMLGYAAVFAGVGATLTLRRDVT